VLYEMLAGRAPFNATRPHGCILKHVTERPAPIGETNPGAHGPPQLEAVIFQSLEKGRDARYASAADFVGALETIRASIPPDQKYGLGDRMITLSGAKTLADLPKLNTGAYTNPGATAAVGGTTPTPRVGPSGTKRAEDEATLVERMASPQTLGGQPTVVDRKSEEPTLMENFGRTAPGSGGGAVPTAQERRLEPGSIPGMGEAQPTVIERQMQMPPPARKNMGVIAGVAAVVVLLLAGIGYYVTRKPQPQQATVDPVKPSGTQISSTAPTVPPLAGGQGVLLLSASPWGDIDRIVSATDQKAVDLSDETRSTPARIELAPGKYYVTMSGPAGKTTTFDVTIDSGKLTPKKVDLGNVNIDELEKEVSRP